MRNGYLRNMSRRNNMLTPSGEQGASSSRTVGAVPSRSTKPVNRDEITLEDVWARSRFHCNLV
ncbi:MAG: hypothetical protein ABSB28_02840 [Candidatus Bathyarchaeia archaeon]